MLFAFLLVSRPCCPREYRHGFLAQSPWHGLRWPIAVNTILLTFPSIILLILTLVTGNETESFTVNHPFYAADCEITRMINLGLHLATNVIATLVHSSSLFIIQVFNAPALGAGTWKKFDVPACLSEYLHCNPRQVLRNVMLVVKTAGDEDTMR